MSTPVIIDGHAFLHLRSQKFTCVELKTGKQTWTTTGRYGQYWSLVGAEGPHPGAGPARRADSDSCHAREVRSSRLKEDQRRGDVGTSGGLWRPGICPRVERHLDLPLAIIVMVDQEQITLDTTGHRQMDDLTAKVVVTVMGD